MRAGASRLKGCVAHKAVMPEIHIGAKLHHIGPDRQPLTQPPFRREMQIAGPCGPCQRVAALWLAAKEAPLFGHLAKPNPHAASLFAKARRDTEIGQAVAFAAAGGGVGQRAAEIGTGPEIRGQIGGEAPFRLAADNIAGARRQPLPDRGRRGAGLAALRDQRRRQQGRACPAAGDGKTGAVAGADQGHGGAVANDAFWRGRAAQKRGCAVPARNPDRTGGPVQRQHARQARSRHHPVLKRGSVAIDPAIAVEPAEMMPCRGRGIAKSG